MRELPLLPVASCSDGLSLLRRWYGCRTDVDGWLLTVPLSDCCDEEALAEDDCWLRKGELTLLNAFERVLHVDWRQLLINSFLWNITYPITDEKNPGKFGEGNKDVAPLLAEVPAPLAGPSVAFAEKLLGPGELEVLFSDSESSFKDFLQIGQVPCSWSQGMIHCSWYRCSQTSLRTGSSSLKSSQHTEHCIFLSMRQEIYNCQVVSKYGNQYAPTSACWILTVGISAILSLAIGGGPVPSIWFNICVMMASKPARPKA